MLKEYYFNNLPVSEQSAYNSIRFALTNTNPECVLFGIGSAESANEILRAVVLDHPEIIKYPGLFYSPVRAGSDYKFNFLYSEIDEYAYDKRLNRLLNRINDKTSSNLSDYAVCKIIFDEFTSFIEYEFNVLEEYLKIEQENSSKTTRFMQEHSNSFSAYGVLMNSKGVCQGIAKLFKIVCDRFGVQCACVEAKTLNSKTNLPNHMLNVVEIDGERAFVDVANSLKTKNLPIVKYDFFLMPQRVVNKTLAIVGSFGCNSELLNYFVKNNLRFTSVCELRTFLSSFSYRSNSGEVRCFYDGNKLSDKELEKIFVEIINYHCRDGHRMRYVNVRNGFCTGLIISDTEV